MLLLRLAGGRTDNIRPSIGSLHLAPVIFVAAK
jgi:hypothetical protein